MNHADTTQLELEAVKKMLELGAGEICPELAAKLDSVLPSVRP